MKFDLHLHTIYSSKTKWPFESLIKPEDLVKIATKRNLDGIAVTDHDTLEGAMKCLRIVKRNSINLRIIPGIEITSRDGHILGLGLEEWIAKKHLSAEETIDEINYFGGIAIAAHPFVSNPFRKGIGKNIDKFNFDGIEILNLRVSSQENLLAKKVAEKLKLGGTAGSDAHMLSDVGRVWTVTNSEDVISEIKKGRAKTFGREMGDLERRFYQLRKFLKFSRFF